LAVLTSSFSSPCSDNSGYTRTSCTTHFVTTLLSVSNLHLNSAGEAEIDDKVIGKTPNTKWMQLEAACDDGNSINLLTPNGDYSGHTALLTSKRCILYIYSTNIGTEYFKHGIYSPYFHLQNAVCFIILTYLVPGLFTFYIQGVLKLKK